MKENISNHEQTINRIKLVIVVIVGIMLVLVQLFFLKRGSTYVKYDLTKDVTVTHNGKKIFHGNIDELKLEGIESEDNLTMYMKIPKNNIINPAIQYDNINTAVKVYIDGKKIYSIGDNTPKGGIVCHVFNKVDLGDISDAKEIVMSIRVMNNTTLTRLPRVTMMNTHDIDEDYFYSMQIYIIVGYYFMLIGVIGFLIAAFIRNKSVLTTKMSILAITSTIAGIYMISTFQVIPMFCDNYILDAYLEYSSRLLMAVFVNMYLILEYPKGKRLAPTLLTTFSMLYSIIALTLQATKVMYLNDLTMITLIMYLLTIANLIYNVAKYKKSEMMSKSNIIIYSILGALLVIYVLTFLFFTNYLDYMLIVIPIIALGIFTILFLGLITEITSKLISDAKKDALEKLAYIDGLTSIPNRRGFNEYVDNYIKKYKKNKQQNDYTIYSFDLNKLKYVNDSYGHGEGDAYIKTFASIIREVFLDGYCARIGGDEFLAIYDSSKNNEEIIKNIDEKVNAQNKNNTNEYKLSYCVGCATYNPDKDDIEEIIKQADISMYKMKEDRK